MLVTLKELLEEAEKDGKAIGCFTVSNMEIAMGTIRAAQETATSIIIQIAEGRLGHTPLDYIGPLMVQAAKNASVKVCVHLDHGLTVEKAKEALSYGFTSVMFDGSRHSLEENIRGTNEIAKIARLSGASVEAELGTVGGKEATENHEKISYTDVAQAVEFVQRADIDALAVAIGNSHGHYAGVPHLNFERLAQLHSVIRQPLVLHGGSGISDADFRKCIDLGIRKINIATASLDALTGAAKGYLLENAKNINFYDLNAVMREGVYQNVKQCIKIFNNREAL